MITGRPVTVGAAFAAEQPALMPLPGEAFDPARLLSARVDSRARVSVRQCYYSVPARYAGRRLTVRLSARPRVEVLDGAARWSRPARARGRPLRRGPDLDHYLEVLPDKPGALPGATALAQAKACRRVHRRPTSATGTPPAASRGDAAGTRALIEVLLAHRTLPAAALIAAMDAAVDAGVAGPAGRDHRRPPRSRPTRSRR